jgi:hypothetical protein
MHPVIRNSLAVLAGIIVGSVVNIGIIMVSSSIIPPPAGADVTKEEGLKASMHLFKPINFLFPFIAHALGTFVGAFVAASIAINHKMICALIVGVFFLAGGIAVNLFMLPSPLWFTISDLALAYIPTAYIAVRIARMR